VTPDTRSTSLRRTNGTRVNATALGVVLSAVGLGALLYQGYAYTGPAAARLGPIAVRVDDRADNPIPPLFGIVTLCGGVALLIATARTGRLA
jgi:hypothetical protein